MPTFVNFMENMISFDTLMDIEHCVLWNGMECSEDFERLDHLFSGGNYFLSSLSTFF